MEKPRGEYTYWRKQLLAYLALNPVFVAFSAVQLSKSNECLEFRLTEPKGRRVVLPLWF